MATCQQMRWKCWGGNIITVRFFIALKTIDKVTPTPHAKQQTHATKIDTSRHTAEQIYCHICMFKTTLKGFIIIKVAIFQLMYYPVSRFLTFPPVILQTAFSLKSRNPSQPKWPANVYLFYFFYNFHRHNLMWGWICCSSGSEGSPAARGSRLRRNWKTVGLSGPKNNHIIYQKLQTSNPLMQEKMSS